MELATPIAIGVIILVFPDKSGWLVSYYGGKRSQKILTY